MKRLITIVLLLAPALLNAGVIMKKSGERIEDVSIKSVSGGEIIYIDSENVEISIPKSDVEGVLYDNGKYEEIRSISTGTSAGTGSITTNASYASSANSDKTKNYNYGVAMYYYVILHPSTASSWIKAEKAAKKAGVSKQLNQSAKQIYSDQKAQGYSSFDALETAYNATFMQWYNSEELSVGNIEDSNEFSDNTVEDTNDSCPCEATGNSFVTESFGQARSILISQAVYGGEQVAVWKQAEKFAGKKGTYSRLWDEAELIYDKKIAEGASMEQAFTCAYCKTFIKFYNQSQCNGSIIGDTDNFIENESKDINRKNEFSYDQYKDGLIHKLNSNSYYYIDSLYNCKSIQSVILSCSAAKTQYDNGKKWMVGGWSGFGASVGIFVAGAIMGALNDPVISPCIGIPFMVIGAAGLATSLSIACVGHVRMNNAYKIYNEHCAVKKESVLSLNLGVTRNGIGLTMNF